MTRPRRLWKTSAAEVGCSCRSANIGRSDRVSTPTIHMSENRSTLQEPCLRAPFHSAYYYRSIENS